MTHLILEKLFTSSALPGSFEMTSMHVEDVIGFIIVPILRLSRKPLLQLSSHAGQNVLHPT